MRQTTTDAQIGGYGIRAADRGSYAPGRSSTRPKGLYEQEKRRTCMQIAHPMMPNFPPLLLRQQPMSQNLCAYQQQRQGHGRTAYKCIARTNEVALSSSDAPQHLTYMVPALSSGDTLSCGVLVTRKAGPHESGSRRPVSMTDGSFETPCCGDEAA